MATPVVLSFSGGKDSVLALERLRAGGWDVRAMLAAFVEDDGTLVMHGVPERLVALQAASLGVTLVPFRVPRESPNSIYEARLEAALEPFRAQGVRHVAFGDLFLEDIKSYRDALMARLGFEPVYPLWHEDTGALAKRFVDAGYRGVAICVDTARLGAEWAGRELDANFFAGLPPSVDPCGENGEFHTFVYDGPGFFYPVRFERAAGPMRRAVRLRAAPPALGRSVRTLRRNVRVRDESGGRALLVRGPPSDRTEHRLHELPLPALPARRGRDTRLAT